MSAQKLSEWIIDLKEFADNGTLLNDYADEIIEKSQALERRAEELEAENTRLKGMLDNNSNEDKRCNFNQFKTIENYTEQLTKLGDRILKAEEELVCTKFAVKEGIRDKQTAEIKLEKAEAEVESYRKGVELQAGINWHELYAQSEAENKRLEDKIIYLEELNRGLDYSADEASKAATILQGHLDMCIESRKKAEEEVSQFKEKNQRLQNSVDNLTVWWELSMSANLEHQKARQEAEGKAAELEKERSVDATRFLAIQLAFEKAEEERDRYKAQIEAVKVWVVKRWERMNRDESPRKSMTLYEWDLCELREILEKRNAALGSGENNKAAIECGSFDPDKVDGCAHLKIEDYNGAISRYCKKFDLDIYRIPNCPLRPRYSGEKET